MTQGHRVDSASSLLSVLLPRGAKKCLPVFKEQFWSPGANQDLKEKSQKKSLVQLKLEERWLYVLTCFGCEVLTKQTNPWGGRSFVQVPPYTLLGHAEWKVEGLDAQALYRSQGARADYLGDSSEQSHHGPAGFGLLTVEGGHGPIVVKQQGTLSIGVEAKKLPESIMPAVEDIGDQEGRESEEGKQKPFLVFRAVFSGLRYLPR